MPSATRRTSLSADTQPVNIKPHSIQDYPNLSHPPHISRLKSATKQQALVEPLTIEADSGPDGFVPGFLHLPPNFTNPTPDSPHHRSAAILLSGAGGGVTGPSSMYLSMACKLATMGEGIPALRLDYRFPARNKYCVKDVKAAMKYLKDMYGLEKFVLVGWSFGGAPVFSVAGGEDEFAAQVVGCATIASQTAETEGISRLAPRPLLLLHGTADNTLSPSCSQRLYKMYGKGGDVELKLFEEDNHALSRNAEKAEEMLCEFVARCAGLRVSEEERREVVGKELLDDRERVEFMRKGGDLRLPESRD